MELLGQQIFGFSSLAELLVAFIDYVLSKSLCILHFYLLTPYSVHKDATLKVNVLHHDMSLLNFLLVLWNCSDTKYSWDFVHSSHLSLEAQESLLRKLEGVSHRGHLTDWGYAVPYCPNNAFNFPLHNNMNTKITTPERNTELPDIVQSTNLEAASSPLTLLSTLKVPTSVKPGGAGQSWPVQDSVIVFIARVYLDSTFIVSIVCPSIFRLLQYP